MWAATVWRDCVRPGLTASLWIPHPGHRAAVGDTPLYVGDISDPVFMDQVFAEHPLRRCCTLRQQPGGGEHEDPLLYYENNLCASVALLRAMERHDVKKIVFSSSAAVYGEPEITPIVEDSPKSPTNTYGETKLAMERLMHWCHTAYGLEYVSLRYFNAAGASPGGLIGEDHTPETHLIPLVLQAAQGKRESVSIFGTDYPTPDGHLHPGLHSYQRSGFGSPAGTGIPAPGR